MIYLFFGQDTYRTRQSIKELTKKNEAPCPNLLRHGGEADLYKLDLEEDDFSKIKLLAGSGSLFSRKKILIVGKANMIQPRELSDFISSFKNSEDTIIFWDEKIDKEKIEIFKDLNIKTQEFKDLTGAQLKNWISDEAQKRGLRLFPAHLERLENIGSDLWAVSNEMDKMMVEGGSYEKPDELKETNAFGLGDSFFTSKKQGLGDLLQLSQQGENEFNLFSYIANHCRTVLLVKYYTEKKQPVSAAHKIHPYVVKKATAISRNLSFNQMASKFKNFFEEDFKIKTGSKTPRESLIHLTLNN